MPEPQITDTTHPRARRAPKAPNVERIIRSAIRAGFRPAVVRVLESGEVVLEHEGLVVSAPAEQRNSNADAAFDGWEGGIHALAA